MLDFKLLAVFFTRAESNRVNCSVVPTATVTRVSHACRTRQPRVSNSLFDYSERLFVHINVHRRLKCIANLGHRLVLHLGLVSVKQGPKDPKYVLPATAPTGGA